MASTWFLTTRQLGRARFRGHGLKGPKGAAGRAQGRRQSSQLVALPNLTGGPVPSTFSRLLRSNALRKCTGSHLLTHCMIRPRKRSGIYGASAGKPERPALVRACEELVRNATTQCCSPNLGQRTLPSRSPPSAHHYPPLLCRHRCGQLQSASLLLACPLPGVFIYEPVGVLIC